VLYNRLTEDQWEKHKEVVASYADLKSEIEEFHEAAYKVHKGTKAAFSTYEKLLINFQDQYGNDTNKILISFKVIQDAIKEDLGENFTHAATEKPPSHTERENDNMETQETEVEKEPAIKTTEEVPTRPTEQPPLTNIILEILIPQPTGIVIDIALLEQPESPPVVPKADKRKGIATKETKEPTIKHVPALREVHQDPDEPISVPYEIYRKVYQLTNDEIQAHMDKEKQIKKAANEAKLLVMSKPELIKVVQEEATKAGFDPKILASAKGG
ncbi:hypothetical protein Tco_1498795, partial [Tanacetum coccineum]